ncbi:trna delta -isopentenylpyrophosphate transferase [Methylobacterium terricola]|uniref:Trna delta-isopentenylpyrophosphate transferase n=1 Tax=Methylobacterium terricola TaxID=2583531 RepID=A0A5C4LKC9_9HYPH|nr:trna delta -isopentenylpyrophosphate transferase [Methylobacterium terricola]TNC14874.1 trna delta -isopentenylpyrophosphate transferase [Methylobacterium terricola]
MSADTTIRDILAKYDEDVRSATWKVQSATVIYHRAIERIAAKAGIRFDPPQILRAERDEAVILVTGRLGDMTVWSIGEAMVNVNYRVSGKQAAYVWAMAEKRAVDRVVLKLIGLHGIVYSENEADEFKPGRAAAGAPDEDEAASRFIAECYSRIEKAHEAGSLIRWWNSEERKQACRDFDIRPDEIAAIKSRLMDRVNAVSPKTEAAE